MLNPKPSTTTIKPKREKRPGNHLILFFPTRIASVKAEVLQNPHSIFRPEEGPLLAKS